DDEDLQFRLSDSVQTAFFEGHGTCIVKQDNETRTFSDKLWLGAGHRRGPRNSGQEHDGVRGRHRALAHRKAERMAKAAAQKWHPVREAEQRLLWTGNKHFEGLDAYFKWVSEQTHKIQYRVLQSRYRGRTTCPDCRGTRLRKDAQYVKIDGRSITDLVLLPIADAQAFFENLNLSEHEMAVADRLLAEITNRLGYLNRVGLGYLTLNRLSNTLSGGESQRISLATSLGSALVGSMYVLDEPSIGLHPKDAEQLIGVLRSLQELGNTVVVVEHEEKMMEAADQVIDIGPEAGSGGGNLMF
nr:probable transport protein [Tanacetum cinerariifolium]